jgi:hypothetical protein
MTMTDSDDTVACLMSMCSVAAIASANAPSYPSLGWLRHWPRPYDAVSRGRGTYPERLLWARLSLPLRASLLAWQLPVGTTTGLRLVWFAHSATLPDSQPVFQAQRLRPWVVRGFTSYESGMA